MLLRFVFHHFWARKDMYKASATNPFCRKSEDRSDEGRPVWNANPP
jgi:hypothetical protein